MKTTIFIQKLDHIFHIFFPNNSTLGFTYLMLRFSNLVEFELPLFIFRLQHPSYGLDVLIIWFKFTKSNIGGFVVEIKLQNYYRIINLL